MSEQREIVWAVMHSHSCDEEPPGHDWREHLPWDDERDEADSIALADALIEALSDDHPYHEACPRCWARFQWMRRRAERAESR